MSCPRCKTEYKCDCESCRKRLGFGWNRSNMREDESDWDETCPGCGKTESIHYWYNLNDEELDRQRELDETK